MSIALPFNRLSVGTGNQASRLARSSSWLNRRSDVRKDVEALFSAIETSRSPETSTHTAATIDEKPVASTSYLPSHTTSEYPGKSEQSSSTWKGKGRAIPPADATSNRKVNGYVEEGFIQRPLSTFFNVNARNDTASATSSSTATTSTTLTDATDSFARQPLLATDQLPRTPTETVQLVNAIAQGPKALTRLRILLRCLRFSPPRIRIAALSTSLAFPVLSRTQWHQKSARTEARNLAAQSTGTSPGIILDDITFVMIWRDLWALSSETLNLPPDVARRTLKNIISLPFPKGRRLRDPGLDSRSGKAMRTLLFLAGLENNPTLAVNVLGYLLQPNLFHTSDAATPSHGLSSDKEKVSTEEGSTDINDIVLILQDLLRSGILTSSTVNKFGLSEVISRAPSMSDDHFKHLLKQTLLRIVLQYYIDHGEQKYISRITGLLDLSATVALNANSTLKRDIDLLLDVARSSMIHMRMEPSYADEVARILQQLVWLQVNQRKVQTDNPGSDERVASELERLVRGYFKFILTDNASEVELHGVGKEVPYLWQVVVQNKLPSELEYTVLDLAQLTSLLRHINKVDEPSMRDLSRETATTLFDRLEEIIRKQDTLDNDLLNAALAELLASESIPTFQAEPILKLYRLIRTSAQVPGGFSLQSKNLRNLVQLARTYASTSSQLDSEDFETIPTSSSIIDHFMRCRRSWLAVPHADYTALAGALMDNEEYDASIQVLQQLFGLREVPSLEDVEICLKILNRSHPDQAHQIISEAKEEGLLAELII